MIQIDRLNKKALSAVALCDVIELQHQVEISQSCETILNYFRKNEQIDELPGSISDVSHMVFYQLEEEIWRFFRNEQANFFPRVRRAASNRVCMNADEQIETYKDSHKLIVKIVKLLRQLMCDYAKKGEWGNQFRECIVELYSLENKIYKWIEVEQELLFPKIISVERHAIAAAC